MTELKKRKNTKVLKPPNIKPEKDTESISENVSTSSSSGLCKNIGKFLLFVIAVPPMLNYASLKQEREFLTRNVSRYDVGFEQKLFLSCQGEGSPTVILGAPTGLSSDSWTPGSLDTQYLASHGCLSYHHPPPTQSTSVSM